MSSWFDTYFKFETPKTLSFFPPGTRLPSVTLAFGEVYVIVTKQNIFFSKTRGYYSTADTCKNCAKCGKGFKIGTNEAYNIKIKIRVGGISKIFFFRSHANMATSDKGISLKKKFLKKFLLNVRN